MNLLDFPHWHNELPVRHIELFYRLCHFTIELEDTKSQKYKSQRGRQLKCNNKIRKGSQPMNSVGLV